MGELQTTYYAANTTNRADFVRTDLQNIIQQKGKNVILEQGLPCACKSKDSNQQSNCKNCGGTGWFFINPTATRMIIQGMNITPDYKAWSEEIKGDIKVTGSDLEELTYMDRLTLVDSQAIHTEVLFFKTKTVGDITTTFAYTGYAIKKIKYIGYFSGVNSVFVRLNNGVDYLFQDNIIKLINPALVAVQGDISVTIRYFHAPVYFINEMKRESMESFEISNGEKLIRLPVLAIARRQHYILTAPNLNGDRLLNNSYAVPFVGVPTTYCSSQAVILPPNTVIPIIVPFTNQTVISVNHKLGRYVTVTVYDQTNKETDAQIVVVDNNNITVTFNSQQSGTIVIN